MQNEIFDLFDKAVEGDREALEELILSVKDMIYNLSLRMLGMPFDAEDACSHGCYVDNIGNGH